MRTVISHFYNEQYMLPWWLNHHLNLFDYGILINHCSTDNSVEIIRQLAPHWRIVGSKLTEFDAYLTDLEVMQYELELPPGWKIALNITEFLLPAFPLPTIEKFLVDNDRQGISTMGFIMVDEATGQPPVKNRPLLAQKRGGVNENSLTDTSLRAHIGLPDFNTRNRFYHSNPTGMYYPGRHKSFHPDSNTVANFLLVAHFGYSPWVDEFKLRKTKIGSRLPSGDVRRKSGFQHLRDLAALDEDFEKISEISRDLMSDEIYSRAITYLYDSFMYYRPV